MELRATFARKDIEELIRETLRRQFPSITFAITTSGYYGAEFVAESMTPEEIEEAKPKPPLVNPPCLDDLAEPIEVSA